MFRYFLYSIANLPENLKWLSSYGKYSLMRALRKGPCALGISILLEIFDKGILDTKHEIWWLFLWETFKANYLDPEKIEEESKYQYPSTLDTGEYQSLQISSLSVVNAY